MNQVRVGPGDPRDARDGYCGTVGPFELATSKEHIFRHHKVKLFWRLDALKDLLFVLLKRRVSLATVGTGVGLELGAVGTKLGAEVVGLAEVVGTDMGCDEIVGVGVG
eukprot:CAMPEP_0182580420 /NCGR_PEP_ID=MMETSP1324-20130603/47001_1 /TAXON_ID=236786 /ORGANISM="Florenciella sp., Strain RCC1587" /LENGTH=107 /DNA_ID=CAMNT_0024796645 /DNA_START=153 /DNA_END=477 /DNA_ORIENTATION=-